MNQKLYDENPIATISAREIEKISWYVGFMQDEVRRARMKADLAEMHAKVMTERNKELSDLLKKAVYELGSKKGDWSHHREAMMAIGKTDPSAAYLLSQIDYVHVMSKLKDINPRANDVRMNSMEFIHDLDVDAANKELEAAK